MEVSIIPFLHYRKFTSSETMMITNWNFQYAQFNNPSETMGDFPYKVTGLSLMNKTGLAPIYTYDLMNHYILSYFYSKMITVLKYGEALMKDWSLAVCGSL